MCGRVRKSVLCWVILIFQALQMIFILLAVNRVRVSDDRDLAPMPPQEDLSNRARADRAATESMVERLPEFQSQPVSVTSSWKVYVISRKRVSPCPKLRRPVNVSETFQFQHMDGQKHTYVFSAFHDERDHLVRVIAVSDRSSTRYLCHLWYDVTEESTSPDLVITTGTRQELGEGHGRKMSAAYIHCPLPPAWKTNDSSSSSSSQELLPYAVSLTSNDCQNDVTQPTNVLRVMTSQKGVAGAAEGEEKRQEKAHNFTVCMKPINMNYGRAHEVVEFIEMSRLLGVTKFQVYVMSVQPNVLAVLRWYQERGFVEMIDWGIDKHMHLRQWPPSSKPPEIHAFGQIASSNDCISRNRWSSRYVAMIDWDEVLAPRRHSNWMELIRALDAANGQRKAGEYSFACLFFRKDFPHKQEDFPGKDLALKYRSNVLLVNKREKNPNAYNHRSKYIADPECVHSVGIHYVLSHRSLNGVLRQVRVPHSLGYNCHYRDWEKPSEYSSLGVQDDDMLRYKDALLERLQGVWKQLPNVSLDSPRD